MSAVLQQPTQSPVHVERAPGVGAFDLGLLTFDEEFHQYTYNGQLLPSVTQVLEGLQSFAGVGWEVMEAARERGTHVHLACQFLDEEDLDEGTLTPDVLAYLQGWKRFLLDTKPTWRGIEQRMVSPPLRFAGTLDRFGELTIKNTRIPSAVVEVKTGDPHPVWGVQMMAYAHLNGTPDARRFSVQLKPDGTYRLLEWTDPQDWPVFMSLLTLRTWQERNGL